jgi:hypothetical protein
MIKRIDRQEVINLALARGNIDNPAGSEAVASQCVYDWLSQNDFILTEYAVLRSGSTWRPAFPARAALRSKSSTVTWTCHSAGRDLVSARAAASALPFRVSAANL